MNKEKEIRQLHIENIETRTEDNGNMIIEGYVATFNSKSKYLGFYEIIDPRAFDTTLADGHNIFMLYNHDWDKPLGDTETGTLKLTVDNIGLRFSLTVDNTVSYAKDVYQLVKKNLIKGCSFGFWVNEDEWSTNDNMEDIRTLLNVTLLECTLTIAPAYNETSASCRSYENYKNDLEKHKQDEQLKRKLKLELELM
ncbi:HK97 family phage prohead protease [Clostridium tetani]|uniref:HK97 family phage prohead protease n=1 Tax=Clostridium tetani TaxID=1513 RepID=UPI00100AAE2B|nr:HK97 family phage prohead protease [Clostridium tetani]RXM57208.1 HK97 family phage prohead protease [Clostridium tetani]